MKSMLLPGMALVAVCYAFARFGFGLFLPYISREFGLDSAVSGFIQSIAYLAYALALLSSSWMLRRNGQRRTILLTGIFAAAGLAGIALSPNLYLLTASLFLAGISTGWVSPALGQIVDESVTNDRKNSTNAWINSGTSFGIILSGPAAFFLASHWRGAYWLFALIGCVVVIWLFKTLPAASPGKASGSVPRHSTLRQEARKSGRLLPASLLAGIGSAVYWTYFMSHLQMEQHLSSQTASLYWIAMGAAGIAGGLSGRMIRVFGIRRAYTIAIILLSASIAVVPLSIPAISLISALVFGAAYIFLTGLFIVWGTGIPSSSPASQISLSFLSLGIGQFAGSWIAGGLIGLLGYNSIFLLFALILLGGLLFYPRTITRS